MIKLYRTNGDILEYAEAWVNEEEEEGTIHTGVVGDTGESEDYVVESGDKDAFFNWFVADYKLESYQEFPDEDIFWITLQFPLEEMARTPDEENFEKLVTDVLDQELGWTGLGNVDGFDAGKWMHPTQKAFVQNIYCLVVDKDLGIRIIKEALVRENLDATLLTIGSRTNQEDSDYSLEYSSNKKETSFYI